MSDCFDDPLLNRVSNYSSHNFCGELNSKSIKIIKNYYKTAKIPHHYNFLKISGMNFCNKGVEQTDLSTPELYAATNRAIGA